MILPKYTPKELARNVRYILLDPPSWFQFLDLVKNMNSWLDVKSSIKENFSILQHRKLGITYTSTINYRRLIMTEWETWKRFYTFPFSLEGKTILDIGAGCGETALFYSTYGAKKIICVEQDKRLIPFLEKNRDANRLDMDILNEPFNLNHLKLSFDGAKMDIDGGEKEFLKINRRIWFPLVAEIHGDELERAFLERGLRTRFRPRENRSAIMDNF